jgi:hypothetical protein
MRDANAANVVVATTMPSTQPSRKAPVVVRGRGVNSRRIAGMIGKGDAAIPSAKAAISGVTTHVPRSLLVPFDRRVVEYSHRVATP